MTAKVPSLVGSQVVTLEAEPHRHSASFSREGKFHRSTGKSLAKIKSVTKDGYLSKKAVLGGLIQSAIIPQRHINSKHPVK